MAGGQGASRKAKANAKSERPTRTSFPFVIATDLGKTRAQDMKMIRSHVVRGKGRPKRGSAVAKPSIGSWIKAQAEQSVLLPQAAGSDCVSKRDPLPLDLSPQGSVRPGSEDEFAISNSRGLFSNSCPEEAPWIMRSLSFTPGMDPKMLDKIFHCFSTLNAGMYPPNFCLVYDIFDSCWLKFMIQDLLFSYTAQFIAEAFPDWEDGRPLGPRASGLLSQVLVALQQAIEDNKTATADTTIGAILFLTLAADMTGDMSGTMNHLKGLQKIVSIRGGVRKLNSTQLQGKTYRADLQFSMISGLRPCFYVDDLTWEPFFKSIKTKTIHCAKLETYLIPSVGFVDPRLSTIWSDVQELCAIVDLSILTRRKIRPELYQEVLVSIQYRLLHLYFSGCSTDVCGGQKWKDVHEAIRLGILGLTTTLFLYREKVNTSYAAIVSRLNAILLKLGEPGDHREWELRIWLLFMVSVTLGGGGDRFDPLLARGLEALRIKSWAGTRQFLKSLLWIDLLHDQVGRMVYGRCLGGSSK
ncbi:unnamed protein product [Clonostachys rosea]|uniref:Transcription factor domain-containing protein n=1 Tax=Bionectria ochroleuca TaxID=29856 RepID=A0ABY6U8X1_BIOOC|nr:unnamed protein product [Clonostachys rosea]